MEIEKQMIDPNAKFVINASILTGHTLRWENGIIKIYNRFGMLDTTFRVADMPTVDAVEVMRGEWVRKPIGKYTGVDEVCCSICGSFIGVVFSDTGFREAIEDMSYCSNCGAKMNGGK